MGALAAAGGLAFSFVFNKARNDKSHNSSKHKADNNRCKIPSYPIEHMTFSFHVSVFVKIKSGFLLIPEFARKMRRQCIAHRRPHHHPGWGNSFVEPYRIDEHCSTQTNANVLIYPILTFLVSFVASL